MIEDTLLKVIGAYGFPIVAFLLIFYQSNTTIKDNTKATRELVSYLKGGRR